MEYLVFDSDDFGSNHVISDQCQTKDCRDMLMLFKEVQPKFKATMFAVPGEMTPELLEWSAANAEWIELAVHGFFHTSNYECEKMTYEEFDEWMNHPALQLSLSYMVKGFKAPGWQISNGIYKWLVEHGYWVADQDYNTSRRPKELPVYKVGPESVHTHTWDCVGNGVYELKDTIIKRIERYNDFRFISEVVNA